MTQLTNSGLTYDADGDMTSDGQYSYTYNAENQITSANGVNYTYDGDGLRVEKSSSASTTLYWRGLSGQVLEETGANGDMEIDYIFFDGRRIASLDSSGNVHYLFSDVLGSVRVATDSSGNVCFDADYYPYGQEVDQGTPTCSPTYKFAWIVIPRIVIIIARF